MRIKAYVEFADEIEIDLNFAEIVAALSGDPDRMNTVFTGISNFVSFMEAVPDHIIQEMKPEQRVVIQNALREQVLRFGKGLV